MEKNAMRVGILYGENATPETDMSRPEMGNPGVGGTQYCIGMLVRYLSVNEEISLTVYQYKNTIFPKSVKIKKIASFGEFCCNTQEDVLICTQRANLNDYRKIEHSKVPIILWVHNHLSVEAAELIAKSSTIKRVVFVGRQLYDLYIDHEICDKSIYIFNMFKGDLNEYLRKNDYERIVTYMGSLNPSKGFHLLAGQWKKILSKVPDAQLYVIGSGNLYCRDSKLGKYGLAEEKYENAFMPYLVDDNGKILDSVHFCGILGQEKYDIFNKTAVGIINPSALTETFGLSAVEMEACGIPIVTKAAQGLLDTTIHKKTGLLYNWDGHLSTGIVKLLLDKELNQTLGTQAKEFVVKTFAPEIIIESWIRLLHEVKDGKEAKYLPPVNFFFKQNKWLRLINRQIQKLTHKKISLMEWKDKVTRQKWKR